MAARVASSRRSPKTEIRKPKEARNPKVKGSQCDRESSDDLTGSDLWIQPSDLRRLRHRHFFAQIDVLNGVQQAYAFFHGPLESLAPGNKSHPACALVDDRGRQQARRRDGRSEE